jgi:ribosomal protein S16
MVVRLRLQRFGRKHSPFYRMVAADARAPRDGKFLEIVSIMPQPTDSLPPPVLHTYIYIYSFRVSHAGKLHTHPPYPFFGSAMYEKKYCIFASAPLNYVGRDLQPHRDERGD